MTAFIAPIVEGQTEARSVERLLQWVWVELLSRTERLQVLQPTRCARDSFCHSDTTHLNAKVEEAFLKLREKLRRAPDGRGLLLVLLDSEDDCPAKLAPQLLAASQSVRSDVAIACVLAKRMFENWLVAGAGTLGGVSGLPDILPTHEDPESCHGAHWLREQKRLRQKNAKYTKTLDALEFVKKMDLHSCRLNTRSFRKLCSDLEARFSPVVQADSTPEDSQSAPPNDLS